MPTLDKPRNETLSAELPEGTSHDAPPSARVGLQGLGSTAVTRGRKPANESRAAEIRQELIAWKQTPDQQRVSLRKLAVELGTSHQLLGSYLNGLNKWLAKDYRRRAQEIRERASAQKRPMTPCEESQSEALQKAAFQAMVTSLTDSALDGMLKRLQAGGVLSKPEIRIVNLLARAGVPMAQKLVQKNQINLPG